ncbi:MAG: cupin domain-containing protein [Leptolyngbyaceae cyanobacterium MO_188.B28]|nr:cupin domain-containing protein [Leptolyngbyaceae cyanobacterium MO_188.B28]
MIIDPQAVPDRTGTNYPASFKTRVAGRSKKRVGNAAGLKNFGVNWVTLAPGASSALRHWHEKQDEFVYIIQGELILITNDGEHILKSGMMAGFPASEVNGHHLVNRSTALAIYLEIGDRTPNDLVHYPDDDISAHDTPTGWTFTHKDGSPY